jgi:oxygen-independent coproporphyrinogen-3 oxidase
MLAPLIETWQAKDLIKMSDGFIELTIAGQFWYVNLTQAMLDWLVMIKSNRHHSLHVKSIAAQG